MGEYFKTTVTGIDENNVRRWIAELIVKGFEVVAEGSESHTAAVYKRINSVGRVFPRFANHPEILCRNLH